MADEIRGFTPKVKINATVWDVQSGEMTESRSTARTDDTAGGIFQGHKVDKRVARFDFKALRKSTINPHASPLNIGTVDIYEGAVIYYPTGDTTDDTTAWRLATAVFEEYRESFNAEQGLVTLSVRGTSSGSYKLPGEA